jgi:3-deoxy-7-phosphoheptulonate synthase
MNRLDSFPSRHTAVGPGKDLTEGSTSRDSVAAQWHPAGWHSRPTSQQPDWTGPRIGWVREALFGLPALVTMTDVDALYTQLRQVQAGLGFILQAGDCAEPFGSEATLGAGRKHDLLGRMALSISERTALPVVTIGRLAGQFAKPRSQPTELVDGRQLPSFRCLIVNGAEPNEAARRVDASRLFDAYHTSHDVFTELARLTGTPSRVDGADSRWWTEEPPVLCTTRPYGHTVEQDGFWQHSGLWTSHEALILDYEEPLTRRDPDTGRWLLASTHLPWVGYRTNHADAAHVEFLSGVANPLACKVGPDTDLDELVRTCARLDPDRVPGRLTLISRQGNKNVRERLPEVVRAVRRAGHPVVWICDPMHGNTVKTPFGLKTRYYDTIADELRGFFDVLGDLGEWPGGVHLEIAADDVTECVGGTTRLADLPSAYRTLCDPRLNDEQSLRLAGEIEELLTSATGSNSDTTSLLAGNI